MVVGREGLGSEKGPGRGLRRPHGSSLFLCLLGTIMPICHLKYLSSAQMLAQCRYL